MKEDIIRMARQIADTFGSRMCDENGETYGEELYAMSLADIEEAAGLVAAAEREACARMAEAFHQHGYDFTGDLELHDAIRARGQA
jgi:hypothetical protein